MTDLVWIVPLHNFDSDVECVSFNERVSLRRITNDELNALTEAPLDMVSGFPLGRIHRMVFSETKYVLEDREAVSPKYVNQWLSDEGLILTLRLLKAGDVKVTNAFVLRKNRVSRSLGSAFKSPFPRRDYFLRKEEVEPLKELSKGLETLASKPQLRFPLKKFTESYGKTTTEDKIVECIIAFESIVFLGVNNVFSHTGTIVGMSVGMLLGESQAERDKIRETMEQMYVLRNCIVHGNAEKLAKHTQKEKEKLAGDAEEYLRQTLRSLIEK
jgi:hypothetical protein